MCVGCVCHEWLVHMAVSRCFMSAGGKARTQFNDLRVRTGFIIYPPIIWRCPSQINECGPQSGRGGQFRIRPASLCWAQRQQNETFNAAAKHPSLRVFKPRIKTNKQTNRQLKCRHERLPGTTRAARSGGASGVQPLSDTAGTATPSRRVAAASDPAGRRRSARRGRPRRI